MKSDISLEIRIPNQTRYLGLIGRIGEDVAKVLDFYDGDREMLAGQINTVLTEALVNAITHANAADPAKEVIVRLTVTGRVLAIQVFDSGEGFDLNRVTEHFSEQGLLDEKGRGLSIIRNLMDSVVYRKADGGNVLEMKKSLG